MAEKGYHNSLFIFVSPPDTGKSDTIDIFLRDFEGVYVIPAATETKQVSILKERQNTVAFILDEPDDWEIKDLKKVMMTMKHISTGKLKPARANSFGQDPSLPICSSCILFLNDEQFKSFNFVMQKTGLLQRAVVVMTNQNAETKDYCRTWYKTHGLRSGYKLPYFKVDTSVYETDHTIKLSHKKWMNRYFSGHAKDTVEWICKLSSASEFEEFKPYLTSHYDFKLVNETIEFAETKESIDD